MAEQHRATAEQWARIERMRHHTEFSTILELRDRIEALESAQPAKPNHPAKPDNSLVERVVAAIIAESGSLVNWEPEARAAIREVAAWLWEQERYVLDWAAVTLEEEAKHRST